MKTIRGILIAVVLICAAWLTASPASAQSGYYESYRPYSNRSLARTGKYHGYWRDQGYGFSGSRSRSYYVPQYNYYHGGYYQGGPVPIQPVYPPPYYHPPVQVRGYR